MVGATRKHKPLAARKQMVCGRRPAGAACARHWQTLAGRASGATTRPDRWPDRRSLLLGRQDEIIWTTRDELPPVAHSRTLAHSHTRRPEGAKPKARSQRRPAGSRRRLPKVNTLSGCRWATFAPTCGQSRRTVARAELLSARLPLRAACGLLGLLLRGRTQSAAGFWCATSGAPLLSCGRSAATA